MVKPVIFQVVGYQNSGKTTVTTKLIQTLKACGLNTATIKHHGHGGKPDILAQKDSAKHLSAGAFAAIVEGEGRLVLQVEQTVSSLEEQIKLLRLFEPDVILIEGHKREGYPKLLLLRNREDLPLIELADNVVLIAYWDGSLKGILEEQVSIPFFSIFDESVINRAYEIIQQLVQNNK